MYLHWREREHEDIDILVDEDHATMDALRQCGVVEVLSVSIHEGTTQAAECLDRLLAYRH
jgi:hypothetical protein